MTEIVTNLTKLRKESQGIVLEIDADDPLRGQLEEWGFIPGTPVSFVSRMPFGGPLAFRIHDTKIALRYDDASKIKVRYY